MGTRVLETVKEMVDLVMRTEKCMRDNWSSSQFMQLMQEYYLSEGWEYSPIMDKCLIEDGRMAILGNVLFMEMYGWHGVKYQISCKVSDNLINEILKFNDCNRITSFDDNRIFIHIEVPIQKMDWFEEDMIISLIISYDEFIKHIPPLKDFFLGRAFPFTREEFLKHDNKKINAHFDTIIVTDDLIYLTNVSYLLNDKDYLGKGISMQSHEALLKTVFTRVNSWEKPCYYNTKEKNNCIEANFLRVLRVEKLLSLP